MDALATIEKIPSYAPGLFLCSRLHAVFYNIFSLSQFFWHIRITIYNPLPKTPTPIAIHPIMAKGSSSSF